VARYAIIVFAVVAAINQLGIAPTVVNTLFIGTVGAVALAVGLAFGLGGRDVASRMTESWYQNGQMAAQRVRSYSESRERREAAAQTGTRTPASVNAMTADAPEDPSS
jgi:hypothetical protein